MAMRGIPRRTGSTAEARAFAAKYGTDPVAYVRDLFDWRDDRPAPYQLDVLEELAGVRKEAVRANRGAGKSAVGALALHWFADTSEAMAIDWKAITTASVWGQLTHFLWPEVHKWARRKRWDLVPGGEWRQRDQLQNFSLRLEHGEASALSPGRYETAEGAHATRLLYIFDEAKLIKREVWDSTEGALTSGDWYWLALSTPGEDEGAFADICHHRGGYTDWHVRRVTLQESLEAGRVSEDWAEGRRAAWGEDHPMYQQYVLGEFASLGGAGLIPLSWVEAAQFRWEQANRLDVNKGQLIAVAADIAGGVGRDETVIARLYVGGNVQRVEIERLRYAVDERRAYTEWAGRLLGATQGDRRIPIVVDAVGVGAGVVSMLAERGANVVPFNGGAKPADTILDASGQFRYRNWRTAAYFMTKEWLDPAQSEWATPMLPTDEQLAADLTAVALRAIRSTGVYELEPKAEVRNALKRSPDAGDVVAMLLAGPVLWAAHLRDKGIGGEVIYRPAMADEVMA